MTTNIEDGSGSEDTDNPMTMSQVSAAELRELANKYDVDIHDDEIDKLRKLVNQLLEGTESVSDIAIERQLTEGHRSWQEPIDDPHNAFVSKCDVFYESPEGELLEGVNIGVKDVIAVANVPLTGGSQLLEGHVPTRDATIVERLLAEGGVITGKTNCDELATSGRGTTSSFGRISNPHDDSRTAGGSSGGSAVAVATGETDIALGTDTSGSVQLPAALCGVIGLKPTYGLIPLSGVIEHAYSMDHVAFFAQEISQVAKILEAGAGPDPADPASLQAAGSDNYDSAGYIDSVQDHPDLSELTVGIVSEGLGHGVKDYVVDTIEFATEALKTEDATISHVSIDHFHDARAINENISYTELAAHWIANGSQHRRGGVIEARAQANLANAMEGASGKLGEYYKSKLLAGAQLIENHYSRYYTQAQAARQTLRSEFTQALEDVDVLLYPSAPAVAPTFEEVTNTSIDFARNTRQATVTRFPAITLPYGEHKRLPTSLQLVANPFQENKLLGIAKAVHDSLN